MAAPASVIELRSRLHVDDLPCLFNPVQVADLTTVLEHTPARRRVAVTLAFAELTRQEWCDLAGITLSLEAVGHWLRHRSDLPFGAACRLAAVLGQPVKLLFSEYFT